MKKKILINDKICKISMVLSAIFIFFVVIYILMAWFVTNLFGVGPSLISVALFILRLDSVLVYILITTVIVFISTIIYRNKKLRK